MKKIYTRHHFPTGKWCKILLIMRIKLIFLLCCAVQLYANDTFSQQPKINANYSNSPLTSVLDDLKTKTGYTFVLKMSDVLEGIKVTANFENASLEEVLEKVLLANGYEFAVQGKIVAVNKSKDIQQPATQVLTITGRVVDESGKPMVGVTIVLKGTRTGTSTDANGQFTLKVGDRPGNLIMSYIGYQTREVPFTAGQELHVTMRETISNIDEVVVVAYGNSTRRDATGSIGVIKSKDIENIPTSNIANLLQGRISGVDVTTMSGAPGSGGTTMVIRGYNSLDVEAGRRFSNPLWIVDGVPLNSFTSPVTGTNLLSDLNPEMIESIQILKDASSAAIYGSRAANGVIIVTTKQGRKNQDANVSVNASRTWEVIPRLPTVTIGKAERDLRLNAFKNFPRAYLDIETNTYKTPETIKEYYDHYTYSSRKDYFFVAQYPGLDDGFPIQDSLNSFYNNQTNFFPAYYQTGLITNANIQVHGGGERITYGVGLGYYDERGVVKESGYYRINLNSNMTMTPVNRLTMDMRSYVSFSGRKRSDKTGGASYIETVPGDAFVLSTLLPGEGTAVWDNIIKNLQGIKENNMSLRYRGTFKVDYEILPGLNIASMLSADYSLNRRNQFSPSYLSDRGFSNSIGRTGVTLMALNENLLTYKRAITEKHNIDFVAGWSYQYDREEENYGSARNSPSDKIYYAPAGMPSLGTVTSGSYTETIAFQQYRSDMQEKTMISYFGRLEYNYDRKYYISASLRRDGSSVFGPDNKWGTFPSIAASWIFSEETFLKNKIVDLGKFRASWGRSGMTFSQAYLAQGIMAVGEYPYLGNATLYPEWRDGLYNDQLSWEQTDQYDFGLDVEMFNYRLGVTLDYYYRYTDRLLATVPLPGDYNAYQAQWRNAAAVSNEGIELTVRYNIVNKPGLYWRASVNTARNWNKFEKSYDGRDLGSRIIGKPLNGLYVLKTNGYFDTQADIPFTPSMNGSYYLAPSPTMKSDQYNPGDYAFVDINGDGAIDQNDRVYAGSALPIVHGGIISELKWRNIDLNMSWIYSVGRHMINSMPINSVSTTVNEMLHPILADYRELTFWENPGDDTRFAKLQYNDKAVFNAGIDRYVEKVNYLKLKTLVIGYTLPKHLVRKAGLSETRVFVSGENLLNFNNYSGLDPETVDIQTGYDTGRNYPLPRKFTLGLTLKF